MSSDERDWPERHLGAGRRMGGVSRSDERARQAEWSSSMRAALAVLVLLVAVLAVLLWVQLSV